MTNRRAFIASTFAFIAVPLPSEGRQAKRYNLQPLPGRAVGSGVAAAADSVFSAAAFFHEADVEEDRR